VKTVKITAASKGRSRSEVSSCSSDAEPAPRSGFIHGAS
jgi:hypothetical protein